MNAFASSASYCLFFKCLLSSQRSREEGAKAHREANKRTQKTLKKAMEVWIGVQCERIEAIVKLTMIVKSS